MTTQQVADRLVELCKAGEYDTCYDELYAQDFVAVGPKWSVEEKPVVGITAMKEKAAKWADMMEEFLWGWTGDPIVAGNTIALAMWFKARYKGETDIKDEEEIIVYTVKDGKIIREEYFY